MLNYRPRFYGVWGVVRQLTPLPLGNLHSVKVCLYSGMACALTFEQQQKLAAQLIVV